MLTEHSQARDRGPARGRAGIAGIRGAWVAGGLCLLVFVACAFWRRSQVTTTTSTFPVEMDPLQVISPPGYLGAQACAECHAGRVAEFEKTNHFRTFRQPVPDTMPVGFAPGRGTFITPDPALRFEMTRESGALYLTAVHTSPSGGEERTSRSVDLILGAGTADDVYLSWQPNGRMYELPVAWLHTSEQWGTANFDPFGGGDYSRELNPRCLECHNTWIHHLPGTPNQYQREHALFGVTCERCHGPGSEHVSFHRQHPEADQGRHIILPSGLTRELQLAVCTQCHSNAMKRRGPAFSYRPGQPLDASFRTLDARHNEDDHVANQIQNLRQSRCFQESDTLTCTDCHDPHRSREAKDAGSVQDSCRKCHQPADCREQDRLPAPVRENCTGCHMPPYVKMNVAFATRDDAYLPPMLRCEHRIAVYPRARDTVLLDWFRTQADANSREEALRLTAALVGSWVAAAADFQSQHRLLAVIGAYREALRVEETPAIREKLREAVAVQSRVDREYAKALHAIEAHHFPEAAEILDVLLHMKPDLAKAHGRLGTALAALGERGRAREHWQAVAHFDSDDAYGEAMLGWLDYIEGHPEAALGHYQRADEIEPYDVKINFHAALALGALNRREEAVASYRRVLQIDPNHAEACHRLGMALLEQGRPEEALSFALRSAALTQYENLDVLLGLTRAYFDGGRFREARATVARARALAEARAPTRATELSMWLNRIEARAAKAKK